MKDRWFVAKFIHRSLLWIFCIPVVLAYIGTGLNEIVLARNGDKFPVMCNDMRYFEREQRAKLKLEKALASGNVDDEFNAELEVEGLAHGFIDQYHVRMGQDTHWNWIADWIDTKEATVSPGDVIIDAGEFLLPYIWYIWGVLMIYKLNRKENNGDNANSTTASP